MQVKDEADRKDIIDLYKKSLFYASSAEAMFETSIKIQKIRDKAETSSLMEALK
jgi:hypothetical protein